MCLCSNSPLSKQTSYNVKEILDDFSQGGDMYPGIQLLSWLTKPVLQHHMVSPHHIPYFTWSAQTIMCMLI